MGYRELARPPLGCRGDCNWIEEYSRLLWQTISQKCEETGASGHLSEFEKVGKADRAGFIAEIEAGAAPGPLVRFSNKTALHWVVMDIVEFLDVLVPGVDIEVVIALFPDFSFGTGAGETLFENL